MYFESGPYFVNCSFLQNGQETDDDVIEDGNNNPDPGEFLVYYQGKNLKYLWNYLKHFQCIP